MKVKDISRTANIAWSPAQQYPIFLAAGTAAQQLDATFSTTAAMEVFALNLSSSDMEMPLKGSVPCEHRFHKLVWGPYGMNQAASPAGMLVGGTDSGSIIMYNANKIISGDKDNVLLCENNKHTGPVQALDFNPFQFNLLATGASDSEIYIWDLNNPSAALTPGNKILPLDNISCLAWNRQVQHILASTSPCGRCVVWDLRKNEPIIKVSDNSAMIRCKAVEWHPDVATQMVLASEDDRYPVIQMWDLRFATSPMKVLEGHQRGILSIAWCPQDPDLLMSCAKDNRILCWNPNIPGTGGEIVYELPTTAQWSFDVRWCPRNPAMICTSSFDGHVSVFSLMGGNAPSQDQQKVNSAFDVDDPFAASIQHAQQNQQVAESTPLKKPPKWLRRPCGASFGFGGKLISFCQNKESAEKQVQISQVTTEAELVKRSNELEGTLAAGSFIEYCNSKIESSTKELERTLWSFLKNNFEKEPRRHFLALLGYDPVELSKKVASTQNSGGEGGVDAAELAKKMQLLTAQDLGKTGEGVFSSGATTPSVTESKTPLSDAGSEAAAAAFDAIASGGPLTINAVPEGAGTDETRRVPSPFEIPTNDETDGLISQALLTGNFEAAVEVCVKAERMADAFLLAIAGGPDLLSRIQRRYFEQNKSNVTRLMSVVINRDWRDIVESCVLENWREALAALVTYAKPEEFTSLCDLLGQRLEQEGDDHCTDAMVCYICAGNVDKFVTCWARTMPPEPSPLALQELIEKVMILKKAVERERRQMVPASSDIFVEKLSKYAELLAAQGCLETAIGYLMASNDQSNLGVLKDRLYNAQYPNHLTTSTAPPPFPFPRVDVLAEQVPQKQVPVQQSLQSQVQRPYGTATSPAQIPTQQVPVPSQQLYQPPAQQSFYNPAAYQGQAPQFPPPGSVGQSPYYSQSSQPIPAQSSWSQQQPPASMYQPSQGNVAPPQIPKSAPFSAQTQPAASEPQIYNPQVPSAPQIYNPASSSTYGGPGAIPSAAPPVMAPSTGPTAPPSMGAPPGSSPPVAPMVPGTAPTVPPPTGLPQTNGPVPTGPPPAGPPPTGPPPISGAWTDTHAVRGRKPQQPAGYPPLAPITSPIFSPQQQPQTNQSPATGVAAVPQGTHGPAVSPLAPQGGTPPGGPPSYTQSLPPAQQQQEPPREVMKGPIPAEHIILQETFDSLVQRCRSTVNNPKTKRKLDEVDKRLEALYDKLREQKLSDQILENLHEIAQACQAADYPRGLMAHTSLISSGSFSEISNFMPGLKAMMQIATQLRV